MVLFFIVDPYEGDYKQQQIQLCKLDHQEKFQVCFVPNDFQVSILKDEEAYRITLQPIFLCSFFIVCMFYLLRILFWLNPFVV
ncbi:unnamed protein product [Linum tenue]|uniref:Uncharacterized protein n=1 Tax=Linum tenue TaxID=586396 RepID=A0AAV0H048_9ROSI|nr:unnamed protein product [Linum tenue]CAI0443871.1 unnamed protein product [Linum tenue]